MSLDNYKDLSTGTGDINAGFQFEFSCARCGQRWRSDFRPYRMGQLSGIISSFSFLLEGVWRAGRTTGAVSNIGARNAKEAALEEAKSQAGGRFTDCRQCHKTVCGDCLDASHSSCLDCAGTARGGGARQEGGGQTAGGRAAASCSNCGTPGDGGRFCPECGFDMASTHKSCPGCGTMVARAARFCTDCGHAF